MIALKHGEHNGCILYAGFNYMRIFDPDGCRAVQGSMVGTERYEQDSSSQLKVKKPTDVHELHTKGMLGDRIAQRLKASPCMLLLGSPVTNESVTQAHSSWTAKKEHGRTSQGLCSSIVSLLVEPEYHPPLRA